MYNKQSSCSNSPENEMLGMCSQKLTSCSVEHVNHWKRYERKKGKIRELANTNTNRYICTINTQTHIYKQRECIYNNKQFIRVGGIAC